MPALYDDRAPYVPPATGGVAPALPPGLDMQAWLNWDPVRRAQYTGINEGVNQNWLGLQGLGNTAVIGTGFAPSGFALDELTRTAIEKANQGGLSTLAQMADAYQRRNAAQTANLGQRGIVRSGAFGANALQSARNYAIDKSQALLALENTLGGYHQQGLAAEQAAIGQRTQSDQDSLDRMIELIKSGIIAAPGAQTGGGGGSGMAAPMKPYPQVPGYNPQGYAPGGSSPTVGAAITNRALQGPLNASYNPRAYVSAGAAPRAQAAIQSQGANPSTFLPGLKAPGGYKIGPYGRAPL